MSRMYKRYEKMPSYIVFQRVPVIPGAFEDRSCYRKRIEKDGEASGTIEEVELKDGQWVTTGNYCAWNFLPNRQTWTKFRAVGKTPMPHRRQRRLYAYFSEGLVVLLLDQRVPIKDFRDYRQLAPLAKFMKVTAEEVLEFIYTTHPQLRQEAKAK